jgi:hypothetical protein
MAGVTFLDVMSRKGLRHVIGIDAGGLGGLSPSPITEQLDEVIFLVDEPLSDLQETQVHCAINRRLLEATPNVTCFFTRDTSDQKSAIEDCLLKLQITPSFVTSDSIKGNYVAAHLLSGYTARRSFGLVESAAAESMTPAPAQMTKPNAAPNPQPERPVAQEVEFSSQTLTTNEGETTMANTTETLNSLMQIEGALGCFIGDYATGMLLAKAGGSLNLEMAAAGNTEVIKAKMKTMATLGLKDSIEDILITLGTQYHVMRPIPSKQGLFIYLALDRSRANLAMARFKVQDLEKELTV